MNKKDLRSVAAALAPVAERLPSQKDSTPERLVGQGAPVEPVVQFFFGLRRSLRKELARLASDADLTMRAFALNALKEKGLPVTDDDLLDLRKKS